MDFTTAASIALVCYLIGSIPFSNIVSRLLAPGQEVLKQELDLVGTDEKYKVTTTGALTASMSLGARGGCLIGFLDMAKAAAPVLAVRLIYAGELYLLVAAVACMAGHNWPVFNRFRGGRGISTLYGGLLFIDTLGAVVISFAGLLLGLIVIRDFLVVYLAGVVLLIPWMWLTTGSEAYVAYAVAVNVVFFLGTLPDLRQWIHMRRKGQMGLQFTAELTPMGRGLMKMMRFLHIEPRG